VERVLIDQDACIVGEPSELGIGLAERGGACSPSPPAARPRTARRRRWV
jgi:hypothetical protein